MRVDPKLKNPDQTLRRTLFQILGRSCLRKSLRCHRDRGRPLRKQWFRIGASSGSFACRSALRQDLLAWRLRNLDRSGSRFFASQISGRLAAAHCRQRISGGRRVRFGLVMIRVPMTMPTASEASIDLRNAGIVKLRKPRTGRRKSDLARHERSVVTRLRARQCIADESQATVDTGVTAFVTRSH